MNVERTGFYRIDYRGSDLQSLVWASKLSGLDRYGLANDAWAFLSSGNMSWKEYQSLLERFSNEEEYLPAFEVSERLTTLFQIAPGRTVNLSRKYHKSQLSILGRKKDENSSLLKGTVAVRLALLDDTYAQEAGGKFKELSTVEPDMKRAVIVGYARSSNDYVTWEWFKDNDEKLDKMYEGTATLSAYMRAYISILGVGRVGEVIGLQKR